MLQVNEYFDGNVKSIGLQTATLPATVGVMEAGEYEFGTSQKEVMTVVSGTLEAKLPGETEFRAYTDGQSFNIDANVTFHVRTSAQVAYFCTYE